MASIPYRFGKLAYRSQGIPPLKLGNDEPAQAVANFQEKICHYSSWPSPVFSAKKMALLLTRVLIGACARHLPKTEANIEALNLLFDKPFNEIAEHIEDLEPAWNLFHKIRHKAPNIGQLVVGNMLNACIYRIKNPGEFALPHYYYSKLKSYFQLSMQFNGNYFNDLLSGDVLKEGSPYPVISIQTVHDVALS